MIPIYQRTYSWTEKEFRQLWDDIIRTGSNDTIVVHFVGSLVYIEAGLSQVTHQAPLDRGSLVARLEQIHERLASCKLDELPSKGTESRLRAQQAWSNWDEAEVERELSSWKKLLP